MRRNTFLAGNAGKFMGTRRVTGGVTPGRRRGDYSAVSPAGRTGRMGGVRAKKCAWVRGGGAQSVPMCGWRRKRMARTCEKMGFWSVKIAARFRLLAQADGGLRIHRMMTTRMTMRGRVRGPESEARNGTGTRRTTLMTTTMRRRRRCTKRWTTRRWRKLRATWVWMHTKCCVSTKVATRDSLSTRAFSQAPYYSYPRMTTKKSSRRRRRRRTGNVKDQCKWVGAGRAFPRERLQQYQVRARNGRGTGLTARKTARMEGASQLHMGIDGGVTGGAAASSTLAVTGCRRPNPCNVPTRNAPCPHIAVVVTVSMAGKL